MPLHYEDRAAHEVFQGLPSIIRLVVVFPSELVFRPHSVGLAMPMADDLADLEVALCNKEAVSQKRVKDWRGIVPIDGVEEEVFFVSFSFFLGASGVR